MIFFLAQPSNNAINKPINEIVLSMVFELINLSINAFSLLNKDFISNAPGHIVVADEQKLRELKIKLDKIQEQLKSFS